MTIQFDFAGALQARIAWLAVGRSTLRKQGAPRMIETARHFIHEMDLRKFCVRKPRDFIAALDRQTERLMLKFPAPVQKNWGAARKVLNIFLRDVFYSHLLREVHGLSKIEPWLEMPLDSYSYQGLAKDIELSDKWTGVKNLKQSVSDRLQAAANDVATRLGTFRVHLDIRYWQQRDLWSTH